MNFGNNIDISVVVPSIRPQAWSGLIKGIKESLHSYGAREYFSQIIFVGPYEPLGDDLPDNCEFIQSWRCPSACLQEGASHAVGEYLCWLPDDIKLEPEALLRCINQFKNAQYDDKDGIILKYSEGENFTGTQHLWKEYWVARTHDGLKFKHITHAFMIAPVFLYKTAYFKEMGGLDCRMEHVNMNCHDLAFRIQLDGGDLYPSCTKVFAADWDSNPQRTVQLAYDENDLPLFKSIWNADTLNRPLKLEFDNWLNTDKKWKRRFA